MKVAHAACLLLATLTLKAQQPPVSAAVLVRGRANIRVAIKQLPRYTCTQDVTRKYFRETITTRVWRGLPTPSCDLILANKQNGRSSPELTAIDRLRLDVANTDSGREIYSWVGGARMEWENVGELIGGGPIGTGPFGPFLIDIFENDISFVYLGERTVDGKSLLEYRFQVPQKLSHYHVAVGRTLRTIAYGGSFWLDSRSAELRRVQVRTTELPAATGSCEGTTTVDFERARIGTGDYLLPRQSLLHVVARNGDESENITRYSACHEYRGESVIRFDDAAAEEQPGQPAASGQAGVRPGSLPPGQRLLLSLETEIDSDAAAAGDPVAAKVVKDVPDQRSKRILAPAGALVHGRITHLEHRVDGQPYFLVTILWETIEIGGRSSPLAAALDLDVTSQAKAPKRIPVYLGGSSRWGGGAFVVLDPAEQPEESDKVPAPIESHGGSPKGGTFIFPTPAPRYIVRRGFESLWRTVAVPKS